jgi:hypothetical protein
MDGCPQYTQSQLWTPINCSATRLKLEPSPPAQRCRFLPQVGGCPQLHINSSATKLKQESSPSAQRCRFLPQMGGCPQLHPQLHRKWVGVHNCTGSEMPLIASNGWVSTIAHTIAPAQRCRLLPQMGGCPQLHTQLHRLRDAVFCLKWVGVHNCTQLQQLHPQLDTSSAGSRVEIDDLLALIQGWGECD